MEEKSLKVLGNNIAYRKNWVNVYRVAVKMTFVTYPISGLCGLSHMDCLFCDIAGDSGYVMYVNKICRYALHLNGNYRQNWRYYYYRLFLYSSYGALTKNC